MCRRWRSSRAHDLIRARATALAQQPWFNIHSTVRCLPRLPIPCALGLRWVLPALTLERRPACVACSTPPLADRQRPPHCRSQGRRHHCCFVNSLRAQQHWVAPPWVAPPWVVPRGSRRRRSRAAVGRAPLWVARRRGSRRLWVASPLGRAAVSCVAVGRAAVGRATVGRAAVGVHHARRRARTPRVVRSNVSRGMRQ